MPVTALLPSFTDTELIADTVFLNIDHDERGQYDNWTAEDTA